MGIRLGKICRFQSGGTPAKSNPEYFNGTIPWITTVSLNGAKICEDDAVEWITEKAIKESAAKIVPAYSIMVGTRVGVGKVAVNTVPMSTSQDIISLLEIDETKWHKDFLCNFIQGKSAFLNSQARGATIKGIKIDVLSNLTLPDVTIEEQIHISQVIDNVRSIIFDRQQELEKLDELIKARFVELFEEKKDEYEEYCLEEIADIVSGITKGRKTKLTDLREVPYMAVSNVKDGYIDWTNVKTILATENEINQYRLLPDDVLMTEGGDPDKVGRGSIIMNPPEDCIHQNHIFRVRLDESRILPRYFSAYLQSLKAKTYFLRAAKQTTGIASINMKQLRRLPTIVPPIRKQMEYVSFSEQVDKSKVVVQKALNEAQLLFDSLMQQYFG